MLILYLICQDAQTDNDALPEQMRLYIAPGEAAWDCAGRLFPESMPVVMDSFDGQGSLQGVLAAFDALLGNLRVLFQDAENEIRIAIIAPRLVLYHIALERLTDSHAAGESAEELPDITVLTTEGGRLRLV